MVAHPPAAKAIDPQILVIDGYGNRLRLTGQRVRVSQPNDEGKRTHRDVPLADLSAIIVPKHGVSLSTDLIAAACRADVALHFIDRWDRPYAHVFAPGLHRGVETRRAQFRALDTTVGARVAWAVLREKLRNQRSLLRYFARSAERSEPEVAERARVQATIIKAQLNKLQSTKATTLDEIRPRLMGLEGVAGRAWWAGVRALLPAAWAFRERRHRGESPDAFNAGLNYGYGILESRLTSAAVRAGLEPFAGFLHVDRPGRPSLVLDLMELYRQPVVDRALIGLARRMKPWRVTARGWLQAAGRKAVARAVLSQLDREVEQRGVRRDLGDWMHLEVKQLAKSLREDTRWTPSISRR